jgi:hypothetical protein
VLTQAIPPPVDLILLYDDEDSKAEVVRAEFERLGQSGFTRNTARLGQPSKSG